MGYKKFTGKQIISNKLRELIGKKVCFRNYDNPATFIEGPLKLLMEAQSHIPKEEWEGENLEADLYQIRVNLNNVIIFDSFCVVIIDGTEDLYYLWAGKEWLRYSGQ